ncbi:MAG TPA: glycosyltransferase [Allocoleopsis sp.]
MDEKRLSVALCTYNGEQYLQEQLDSIASQTRLPDELVVCDDASTDKTTKIVASFQSKVSFPVRLYLNQENLGLWINRGKAIEYCTGDIIVFCDQDDVCKLNRMEIILSAFSENIEAGYVFSDADLVNENLQSLGATLWKAQQLKHLIKEYKCYSNQARILLKQNLAWGATLAIRSCLKNFVLPISPFYYMDDSWIALIASCAGYYGIPLSASLIYYRQHQTQLAGGLNTLSQKLKRARSPKDIEIFKRQIKGLMDAKNHLLTIQNMLHKDTSTELKLIQEKAEHFSQRVLIRSSTNFPLKLKATISEVLTGKYHRFSNVWYSIAFPM